MGGCLALCHLGHELVDQVLILLALLLGLGVCHVQVGLVLGRLVILLQQVFVALGLLQHLVGGLFFLLEGG